MPPHQVETFDDGLCFRYAIPGPPQGAAYQGAGTINHCQRLYLPFTIHHERLAADRRMANFFTCQPISATRTRRYMWVTRTGQFDAPIEESQAITDLIREQDAVIVEAQRPEELPVDLSEELHLHGSDAVAVAYRRQLAGFAIE